MQWLCAEYGIAKEIAARDLDSFLDASRSYFDQSSEPEIQFAAAPHLASASLDENDYLLNGFRIRIFTDQSEINQELEVRLESLRVLNEGSPDFVFHAWSDGSRTYLSRQSEVIAVEENPNAVRSILLQEMVRCTETDRKWTTILHAAACGTGDSCVLIAGPSHSGKTTLSAALLASGMTFYCDDSAALAGSDWRISPMPFRMMVREGSWSVLHSRYPELLASPVVERWDQPVRFIDPLPLRFAASPGLAKAIVFVSFAAEAEFALIPILPFEALLKLQESGFWVEHGKQSIENFLHWVQRTPAFTLYYSDLDEAVAAIRELADRESL